MISFCLLLAGEAHAATMQKTVRGQTLGVGLACFRQLRIEPSASLRGTFRIVATAEHDEELARLLIGAPGGAVVRMRPGGCWQPSASFRPTLDVAVEVPAATPIALELSGSGVTTIGSVGGRVSADLSGAGGLTVEQAEGVKLVLSGTPTASIGSVTGDATIEASGKGEVTIDRVNVDRLSVALSGAGAILIGGGRVGTAKVESEGIGKLRVEAVTGDASAQASGASHVTFARVTGRFEQETEGMSTIGIAR